METAAISNPTDSVDISFASYLAAREKAGKEHMIGGVPDYAFDLDLEMRRRINAIPGIFRFFKAITENYMPWFRQQLNLGAVLTGPNQYPDIHEAGVDCARRLGIGIPQIYVKYDVQMNAYTYAVEDSEPLIVLHSAIVENMTPGELKTIIGHECGHIHNNHGIYNIAAEVLFGAAAGGASVIPGLSAAVALLTAGFRIMFMDWSRCAEITCDRAGFISGGDLKDAMMVNAKLAMGGIDALKDINIDEYLKQIDVSQATVGRFMEMMNTHPVSHKRILATKLFNQCDLFYKWRPDLKTPDTQVLPKTEVDRRCREFIQIYKKAKDRKGDAAK
jgi:Zn-dependent protease with chaperone function